MKSIIHLLRRVPKRAIPVLAAAAALVVPAAIVAWGPGRETYTIENPAPHVTFNSIANNPEYGDERSFLTVRDLTTGETLGGSTTVVPGHEYLFQVYVHNDAASNLNSEANGQKGVAKDTTLEAAIPSTVNGEADAAAYLRASNATPQEIWDTVQLKSNGQVSLDYQEGSARLFSNHFTGGTALDDSVMTESGVKIGYDNLNGIWPGCLEYSGTVTFRVKAGSQNSEVDLQKEVRKDGESKFAESVSVEPGSKVNYRLVMNNSGDSDLNNVVLKDTLPEGVNNVPGTVRILNASNPGGAIVKDGDKLFSEGINIGNYTAGSNAIVIFDAVIASEDELECGKQTLTNTASATPEGQTPDEDSANVETSKECAPSEKPAYTCDYLKLIEKETRDTFVFEAKATAEGSASIKEYHLDFGDGESKIFGPSAEHQTHTYANPGDYTATLSVSFEVDGKTVTDITSEECAVALTVAQPGTPEAPEELPSTGPASIIAGIVGVSGIGYGVHTWVSSRRNLAAAFRK